MKPITLFCCFALAQCSFVMERPEIRQRLDNQNEKLTVDLIKYCFPSNKTIGLIGDAANFSISRDDKNSYLLLDSILKVDLNEKITRTAPLHHVDLYVVAESSPEKLGEVMEKLRRTTWWHHDTLYVLTSPKSINDSNQFFHFFKECRKRDMIKAVFIHDDIKSNRSLILTYNIFNPNAPKPWKFFRKIIFPSTQFWTLFKQEYKLSREVCKSLLFDRMNNLTNYPVAMLAVNEPPYVDLGNFGNGMIVMGKYSLDDWLWNMVTDYLKVNASLDALLPNGNSHEVLLHKSINYLVDRKTHIFINSMYCHKTQSVDRTYPIFWTAITSATKRKPMSSEKTFQFMPPYIIALLMIIGIITVLGLAYVSKDWDNALISVIQLILSQSIRRVPITTPGRLFIIMVFILYIITNSVLQGNVVQLLTTPKDEFNVETIDDINKFGYKVVTNAHVERILSDHFPPIVRKMELNFHDDFFLKPDEIYIDDELKIKTRFGQLMHTPKQPFFTICKSYLMQPFCPFLSKINKVLFRIFESGFLDKARDHLMGSVNRKELRDPPLPHHTALKLGELSFAFVILLIGLSCSTIVFLIEVISVKMKERCKKNGIKFANVTKNFKKNSQRRGNTG